MISLLLILIVSMTLIIYHSFNNIEGKKNKKPKVNVKKVGGKIDKTIDKGVKETTKTTDKVAKETTKVSKQVAKETTKVSKQVVKGVNKIASKAQQIAKKFANLLNMALIRKAHKIFDGFVK